jgi:GH24 family phage-related lysozyme (muramidase)
MTKAGYPKAKGSASAISWTSYGVACAPGTIGAIIVLKSSDRTSTTSGNHVAFCLGTRGDRTLTLGGNQSGNAVTESSVSTSKIFAWRMPPGSPSNSVASGAASVAATGPYRISQQGINFIKNNEGCKLQAYQDSVGVWTIGYGHTKTVRPGMTISYAQAEALLRQDITFFENSVNSNAKVKLTQSMFDALVSFIYNLGPGKFSRTSTVGSLVNNRQYMPAANSILQYNKAKGKVLAGLTKRRQGERAMFLSQGSNPV